MHSIVRVFIGYHYSPYSNFFPSWYFFFREEKKDFVIFPPLLQCHHISIILSTGTTGIALTIYPQETTLTVSPLPK